MKYAKLVSCVGHKSDTVWRVAAFAFLTNHGATLLCIAEDPTIRMRDIAVVVQVTERAAQRIVSDLITAGYVARTREGRRNIYTVRTDLPIPLLTERDVDLGSLLSVLLPDGRPGRRDSVALLAS